MGYEIKYANLKSLTEAEKEERAIQDLFDYVGEERTTIIRDGLKGVQFFHELDQWNITISFCGVEGYPVRCAIKKFCGGQRVLEEWSKVPHWEKGHPIAPFKTTKGGD